MRSEEHTSELQSLRHLVCRLLLEKKKKKSIHNKAETAHEQDAHVVNCHHRRRHRASDSARLYGYRAFVFISSGFSFFFFNDTATTEIYTLSLHDALPI